MSVGEHMYIFFFFHDNDFAITLVLLKKRAWDKPGWFIERRFPESPRKVSEKVG